MLNIDLLRGELGFEGLLVSDATVMGGLTSWMDRAEAVPAVIENGCDMFLFSRNPAGDIALMHEGLLRGALSEARLDEAVTRVLELKALLGLHRLEPAVRLETMREAGTQLRSEPSCDVARRAGAAAPTLIKDVPSLLPITPARHRRIVLAAEPETAVFIDGAAPRSFAPMVAALVARGFAVRAYDPAEPPTAIDTDLLLYALGRESTPVIASAHIGWAELHGSAKRAMLRHRDIPTVMVAFGHPYLLTHAQWVGTFVNAYSAIDSVQSAVIDVLTGTRGFEGVSPVDPFCGRLEARY